MGLAVIERIRARQRATITWLRAGDANTRFFQLKANGRRRKNFITSLRKNGVTATTHSHKAELAKAYFMEVIGTAAAPPATFDWASLGLPTADLSELEGEFSANEIRAAISDMPSDKAPGPDGFSGAFFKATVDIILPDLVLAFRQLFLLNSNNLTSINSANIVLIPKCDGAASLTEFWPISLLHSVAKLFMKVLATRLAKRLDELISPAQSAFARPSHPGQLSVCAGFGASLPPCQEADALPEARHSKSV